MVTMDGVRLTPAASLTDMMRLGPTDPPSYYLLSTADGLEMVLFIPHFSGHEVQIIPIVEMSGSVRLSTELIATGGFALVPGLALFIFLYARERKQRTERGRQRAKHTR